MQAETFKWTTLLAFFTDTGDTGDTDACFSTDFCGFRCVRRVSPEELQQLRASK